MAHRTHLALLAAAVVASACGRPEPAQQAQGSDTAQTDPARPAVPPSVRPEDTVARAAPLRDTLPSAPPRRSPGVDSPPTDTGHPAAPPRSSGKDTVAAPAPLRDIYHPAPLDTVDGRTYQGWKYYNLNCSRCHGEDVNGTTIAPHLMLSLKPDGTTPNAAVFMEVVCAGRPEKGMPAWCALGLTPAQIDTIYAYVKGRSDATLHAGRPARRAE